MYFTIDDAEYNYEITGTGPALVCLHGFTGTMATWKPFIEVWQKQFTVITIDLPGHGETVTESPIPMNVCCAQINKLLESLQIDTFHLLGYSLGGRTALAFASLYPAKIKSLVLESASPGLKTAGEREDRMNQDDQLAERIEMEGIEAFTEFWTNIALFESQRSLPKTVQESLEAERLNQSESGLAMSLRTMGTGCQDAFWDTLGVLKFPVLLIAGELDEKFTEINQEMAELLPKSKLEVIKDAGHAIHLEQPDTFVVLVANFIDTIR